MRRVAAGFAFLVLCSGAGTVGKPSPAMWKLESGGSTMYFLGSMHVLPAELEWMTPSIQQAMAEADIFYFETAMSAGSSRRAEEVIAKEAYLPQGKTLSGMLTPQGRKDLEELARDLNLDLPRLNRLRPWTAGLALGAAAARSRNFTYGVDMQVAQYSQIRQKPRRYFETTREQMEMLVKLDAGGMDGFEESLRDFRRTPETLDRMTGAWAKGDIAALTSFALDGLNKSPATRKVLLEDRNRNWVAQVPALLKQKRTFFITVGAAHLYGPQSVVELLCAQKLPVQRIDTASGRSSSACGTARPMARNAP
jgi:uncharacterized protein YbaP (TraB family)